MGENVRGIASWSDGLVFEEVFADLESEGYEVQAFLLPAVGINAPHKRDRFYFVAKDTSSNGCLQRKSEQEGAEVREFGDIGTGSSDRVHLQEGNSSDSDNSGNRNSLRTDGIGTQEMPQRGQSFSEHRENGIDGNPTDSQQLRLEHGSETRNVLGSVSEAQTEECESPNESETDDHVHPEQGGSSESWSCFPIKSPLCSGDDGLPLELDGLTFREWRKQSIMGYGNAIVPQIAYRIFATIYETENR